MSFYQDNEPSISALLEKLGINYPLCDFSIGPGWMPIVEAAFVKMITLGWDRDLQQVKQKFCGLRIYIGKSTDEIREVIAEAEGQAGLVCEKCGQPHGLETPAMGTALCPKCEKETGFWCSTSPTKGRGVS